MRKKNARKRRLMRTREHLKRLRATRLCVYRTPRHIYAQVVAIDTGKVLAFASTVEVAIKSALKVTGNVEAAKVIGKTLAERASKAGVTKVSFDRSGFKYHGRVKALADAAREGGMEF